MHSYNMIISSFGPMVFSRTEQEAKHLGMFLSEMLTSLNTWSRDEEIFKRECLGFPGFLNSGDDSVRENEGEGESEDEHASESESESSRVSASASASSSG